MRSMKLKNIVEFSFTSVVLLFKEKKHVENVTWFGEQERLLRLTMKGPLINEISDNSIRSFRQTSIPLLLDMSAPSSTYKLIYFDLRALAETSRMLFKAAGQPFEDFRYPFTVKDGEFIRPEWVAAKSSYIYEKIPVLEIDGGKQVIPQSKAIERFLARRFNMLGDNDVEAALIGKKSRKRKNVRIKFSSEQIRPVNRLLM